MWEQVSGAAKLQAEQLNNYYEAMVHQGEASSPSARQIELVIFNVQHVLACHTSGLTNLALTSHVNSLRLTQSAEARPALLFVKSACAKATHGPCAALKEVSLPLSVILQPSMPKSHCILAFTYIHSDHSAAYCGFEVSMPLSVILQPSTLMSHLKPACMSIHSDHSAALLWL